MRNLCAVFCLLTAFGCSERSFEALPVDTELLVYAQSLAEVSVPEDRACTSLFCFGMSAYLRSTECLGLASGALAIIDDETIDQTTEDLDQGVARPDAPNGYVDLGGWRRDAIAWRCSEPSVQYYPGQDVAARAEHTIRIESEGTAREVVLADDGEILACGFPRCRLTGDWEDTTRP